MAEVSQNLGAGSVGNGGATITGDTPNRSRTKALFIVLLVVAIIGSAWAWMYYSVRESTDDAQIEGHIHPTSARVGGTVIAVHIKENQIVKAGDSLFEIDPTDYRVALDRAKADLAEAEASLESSHLDVPIVSTTTSGQLSSAEASVREARANISASEKEMEASAAHLRSAQARVKEVEANLKKANKDRERFKTLLAKDEISQQQYDAAEANADALNALLQSVQSDVSAADQNQRVAQSHIERDKAKLARAEADAKSAQTGPQQVALTRSRAGSSAARVLMAKAALEQAELNLQYTTVRAAIDGQVSRKSLEVGQIVQPGQPVFAIVTPADIWVQANFKETQLKNMRPGQHVIVEVDAFGSQEFKAHVDSIAAATGSKFSLLPPENASGNYVKVIQRVPVRIYFDDGEDVVNRLRPGMSVTPTVITKQ